jgi:hypothetical protein
VLSLPASKAVALKVNFDFKSSPLIVNLLTSLPLIVNFLLPKVTSLTTEKTITVTVTKNPDNGEHVPTFRITTANVSTLENTDKVIKLTVNKNGFNELIFGKRKFTMSGKDVNKFTISDEDLKSKLTFKATAFVETSTVVI